MNLNLKLPSTFRRFIVNSDCRFAVWTSTLLFFITRNALIVLFLSAAVFDEKARLFLSAVGGDLKDSVRCIYIH